jgi:lipoprotein-anchoring transpeptidase ErfK/SrfK
MGEEESDITDQFCLPIEVQPMTVTTEKIQPLQRNIKLAKRWFLIIILCVLLLLTASRIIPAHSSYAPLIGNLLVTPSLTPSAADTATATSTITRTSEPTGTKTSTATATSTSTPTATKTSTSTATKTSTSTATTEITIKVVSASTDLRAGPGNHYAAIRKLNYDEPLTLLGRYVYDTWLYVITSDGQKGWVRINTVNLTGVTLKYQPVQTPDTYPEVTISVSNYSINLRAGPGTNYSKLGKLSHGDPLTLLGQLNDHSWLYVRTSDGQEGWIPTISVYLDEMSLLYDYYPIQTPPPIETSTPVVLVGIEGHWIDIDLSEQMLYAYDGTDLVDSFLVSTGVDQYPTETGQYHIYVKYRSSLMHGNDYYLPDVPYTMYYSGDFSIHGTYWHHNFGTPMSHGCVNMDTSDAEWLYNWASVGTLVNIHR